VIADFVIDALTRTGAHLAPRLKSSPNDLIDFMDTIGVPAESLRIDAAMLVQASTAGLAIPCCIASGVCSRRQPYINMDLLSPLP
jgi:hypothetical protein